jgi:predicted RNA binding protein YcfA (HicA-like mRNA interferase family)
LFVSKRDKTLERVLSGSADASIAFRDLCSLLIAFGFEERVRGSHHIFRKRRVDEAINLQEDGAHAKPYQVKQVRSIILKNGLSLEEKP